MKIKEDTWHYNLVQMASASAAMPTTTCAYFTHLFCAIGGVLFLLSFSSLVVFSMALVVQFVMIKMFSLQIIVYNDPAHMFIGSAFWLLFVYALVVNIYDEFSHKICKPIEYIKESNET